MHSLTLDRKICVMHTPNKSKEPTAKKRKNKNELNQMRKKNYIGVCVSYGSDATISTKFSLRFGTKLPN